MPAAPVQLAICATTHRDAYAAQDESPCAPREDIVLPIRDVTVRRIGKESPPVDSWHDALSVRAESRLRLVDAAERAREVIRELRFEEL